MSQHVRNLFIVWPIDTFGTVVQEQSSRFKPATVLEPGKLMKDVRLIGVQVGCVIGKSGENINQIRKVHPVPDLRGQTVLWQV